VPEGLDMPAAAALPIAFGTAHHCLFARGGLKSGETVLIQAGAGGVGIAAIQLAHRAGATVLATVSGAARAEPLLSQGLDHAIDHRSADVIETVLRLTEGRGVDLVVDPVGATLQTSLAALRPEGRLVFVGNAGGSQLSIDLWPALQANQSLFGVFMGTQLEKPDVYRTVSRMLDKNRKRFELFIRRLPPFLRFFTAGHFSDAFCAGNGGAWRSQIGQIYGYLARPGRFELLTPILGWRPCQRYGPS
jgi:NADPH:quinone reductase-like Zn-dependent oxidoreductase